MFNSSFVCVCVCVCGGGGGGGGGVTGPDPDTLPGYPGWSRLVESHCTIPRECTKGPHLKEK